MKSFLTQKIFRVIDVLIRNGHPMSVIDLSRSSGIERNACWRIVSDLCEMGYLRKSGYRLVEPGLGMIYLGQAVYAESFFPQRAINMVSETARKLKVSAALAGIFNNQIVYLYREGGNLPDYLGLPLYASNMAFCILYKKYGLEKAWEILSAEAERDFSGEELEQRKEEFAERLRHLEKYGYAMDQRADRCNISFPVECKGECFGLALFNLKCPSDKMSDLIIKASQLRNELKTVNSEQ